MKVLVYTWWALLLCLTSLVGRAQEAIPYGRWVVTQPAHPSAEQALPKTHQPYLGQEIRLHPKKFKTFFVRGSDHPFRLEEAVCQAPEYRLEREAPEVFERENRLPAYHFFPDTATYLQVLYVSCPESKGAVGGRFYLLPNEQLLLSYQGLLLHFQRKRKRFLFFRF